jgi:integrase
MSNKKLLDQIKEKTRTNYLSIRTEQTYCQWIMRFIQFYKYKIHPRDMGKNEIEKYLSFPAVHENVSASTQKAAFNSIMFLYREVLDIPIHEKIAPPKSTKHPRMPVVLTRDEVKKILNEMQGTHRLMANLFYGGGLRLMECIRLRVQALDFDRNLTFRILSACGTGRQYRHGMPA